METAIIARRQLFSSAHLYKQAKFTDEQNRAEFGACFTEHGHGHNYVVEAFIEGPIDEHTRLVIDLAVVDEILKRVVSVLDHKHLNFDVPAFRDGVDSLVPTTENIALYLREKIRIELGAHKGLELNRLRLYETDDLWVEVFG